MTGASASSYIQIGPTRIRVRVVGEGSPLLMIMGLGGNLDMWNPLAAALPGRRLLMFDFPGTGGSGQVWLPPHMAANAWLTRRVVRTLGYEHVDVLGYSWGGFLAQQLALQHPRTVRRLILAGTTMGWGGLPPSPRVLRAMLSRRRYYSRSYFKAVAPTIYGGKFRTDPTLADQEVGARLARPPSRMGYLTQLSAAMTFTSLPYLGLIRAPTLVIAGDDDPLARTFNAKLMGKMLPHGELQIVPGGGHLFLIDSPGEAALLIEDFLAADGTSP